MKFPKKLFKIIALVSLTALSLVAQKQLDSTYTYLFRNNVWQANQRWVYTYSSNSKVSVLSNFDAQLNAFKLFNSSKETYDPKCNNQLLKTENSEFKQGVLEKLNTTVYERDNQCRMYQQSLIRAALNDTSVRYIFSDFDANKNAKREKIYTLVNAKLALTIDRKYDITYHNGNNFKSYTSFNVVNGSNVPHKKEEYEYNGDKLKSITYFNYDTQSGTWKKFQEIKADYMPKLEVYTNTFFNNPAGSMIFSLDSVFFDDDHDKILSLSYSPTSQGLAKSAKIDYFYSKKSTSIIDRNKEKLDIRFSNIDSDRFNIEIKNPKSRKFRLLMHDLFGRRLHERIYDTEELIIDDLPNFRGLKVITIFDQDKIGYSKILGF